MSGLEPSAQLGWWITASARTVALFATYVWLASYAAVYLGKAAGVAERINTVCLVGIGLATLVTMAWGAVGLLGYWPVLVTGLGAAMGLVLAGRRDWRNVLARPLVWWAGVIDGARRSLWAHMAEPWSGALILLLLVWLLVMLGHATAGATKFLFEDYAYHMPKAAHWLQSGRLSLAPVGYPAYYPAGGEVLVAFLMLPLSSDTFASLFNACALVLSVSAAYSLGSALRLSRTAKLSAPAAILCMPVVQTVFRSVFVDILLAGLILSAIAQGLCYARTEDKRQLVLAGISLGLPQESSRAPWPG